MHIYSEYLVSIRTLSVLIDLDSLSQPETRATISPDGVSVQVQHHGDVAGVQLPVTLQSQDRGQLQIPAVPSTRLQYRFQIYEEVSSNTDSSAIIPWTAADLSDPAELSCRRCDAVIVARGAVKEWKDLPSENWAEMMDFWHCHKPNEPHAHDQHTDEKGYAAQDRLTAQRAVGLVNVTSFLLSADDCGNILSATPSSHANSNDKEAILYCASCNASIGTFDDMTQSYKLAKVSLSLSHHPGGARQSFSAELWLSCRLLNAAESQGLRKFTLLSTRLGGALLIWIFTPDLYISSSKATLPQSIRVAKVLWKYAPSAMDTQGSGLDSQSLSEGEMEMPSFELKAMEHCLERSSLLLPEHATHLMGWNVALLQRFVLEDIGTN
ncbi:hypothetical protein B0A48_08822 [Cryoendolithus antarcticus]|uniref:Ubiquitin-conjugating enzyme E2C-binding protein n=1 Tax=Cryoendolithus antarcticus TaxID=1507870 RepID=A0A1V8T4L2_9PEZI|nr:hypothetical protein B0A48_08822 [Cryoendolithus antarcticus]